MVRTSRPLVERMTLVWHDWFATSLAGVGSQKLMLNQNKLLRRLSLGSFDTMLREITKDPAMLLWLSGTENTKWSPNENYARELMELFTLGAGRGYSERDVREQARALTGFDNDWKRGAGNVNFRFDRERRRRHEAHLRQARYLRLAGRRPALPDTSEARVLLRRQALALLHPDRAGRGAPLARGDVPQGLRDPSRRRGDPRHPAAHGPADGEAGRVHGGAPAGDRARDRHDVVGLARVRQRPAPLHAPERRRLGRRALARHRHLPRPLVGRELCHPALLADRQAVRLPPAEPQALVEAAIAFWGSPTLRPATRAALVTFASRAMGDANAKWKKTSYRFLTANALRQLIAVSPDLQTS